jgi:5'-nucleotidase
MTMDPTNNRDIFVNRTLNLRSIDVIGYDMDYTLVHYNSEVWEGLAFTHAKESLMEQGWDVEHFRFDEEEVILGLVLDLELGNLIKATRFGYVIRASHGSRFLTFDEMRAAYGNVRVALSNPRFVFLNTLFSLSEASLYAQLVDQYDSEVGTGAHSFRALHRSVLSALDTAHMEGRLKADVIADLESAVALDPEVPLALLDQMLAGKRLVMITNSDWLYAKDVMAFAFDRFLPGDMAWRDLFEMVIVQAAKPRFFSGGSFPYKVVDEDLGLLQPHIDPYEPNSIFHGGNARLLEQSLGVNGDRILYVGDHLFGDVQFPKEEMSWRTALILRQLENEVTAANEFGNDQALFTDLMAQKDELNRALALHRLNDLRDQHDSVDRSDTATVWSAKQLQDQIRALDEQIAPMAIRSGKLHNDAWGPIMRAGVDKSLFARQVERYADIYTSRAANFGDATPYGYLRASRSLLPHD